MTINDDERLIVECLNGNKNAYGILVDRYQKPIFNTALRMVKDYDSAADITQNAFIKAYETLDRFDKNKKFFSWMYKIMLNEALNYIKNKKKFSEVPATIEDPQKKPDEIFQEKRLNLKVENAVNQLDIEHKIIIILRHFIDLSYIDISFILDIPEKTVKSRLYTARKKLCMIFQNSGVSSC